MKPDGNAGLTLVELLLSMAIMGFIAAAAHALVSPALGAREHADQRASLHHEGVAVTARVTEAVRLATQVHLPSASEQAGGVLALSGFYADEDPLAVFEFRVSGGTTFTESHPAGGRSTDLSHHVTFFRVERPVPEEILIVMEFTGADGETVRFEERVCARNVYQKTGKRVQ